ncbi:MAG: DUF4347 domain-containing protein [Myxococcales bacterium]|nr:DUF4347 domain-containing protein [Myxococcales bacterium]MCB9576268.1 DUF4347 domain-containing protein [Polyangiaceae bacterium]
MSRIWSAGARLYQSLDRVDERIAAGSWQEALVRVLNLERPIAELQVWAHGKWGDVRLGPQALELDSFQRPSSELRQLRERLAPGALVWFRTCETFGAHRGQAFASVAADWLGCTVAGHTHVIGYWQSGLHVLAPGAKPTWSADEGLLRGTPEHPLQALPSTPFAPNTVTCLEGSIPAHFT